MWKTSNSRVVWSVGWRRLVPFIERVKARTPNRCCYHPLRRYQKRRLFSNYIFSARVLLWAFF